MSEHKLPPEIQIGKFIDPLSDFGFKFLFGSEPNKELLIAFLNELFEGRKRIVDLSYNKNENHGPQNDFRRSIYDLTCTSQNGEKFIIEVQRMSQRFFKDRMVYYTAAHIHDLAPKGAPDWNYSLKEVYLIGIMDFCFDDSDPQSFLHRVRLTYQSTKEVFYNKLEYIFIEIPKFNKQENELETDLDRWLFALKHMNHLEKIPVYLNKGIFQKLFTIAEIANLSKEEYMNYHDRVLMAQWDEYAQREWLKEQALKEGLEEGLKEGLKEGLAKGRNQGLKEGLNQGIKMAAKSLLLNGFTITQTAKLLGVTEDFVQQAHCEME